MRFIRALLSGTLACLIVFTVTVTIQALPSTKGTPSGLQKGDFIPKVMPYHVNGVYKNTTVCPACAYARDPAVQVWVNSDNAKNVGALVDELEKQTKANAAKQMHAFVIFINPDRQPKEVITNRLRDLAAQKKLQNVVLTFLPGPDNWAIHHYKINTAAQVKNTVFIYRNRKLDTKFVNLVADKQGLTSLRAAVKRVL